MRAELYRGGARVFDGAAHEIVLPCEDGELTVLPGHAPTVCALAAGTVLIDGAPFPLAAGTARIDPEQVLILTEQG